MNRLHKWIVVTLVVTAVSTLGSSAVSATPPTAVNALPVSSRTVSVEWAEPAGASPIGYLVMPYIGTDYQEALAVSVPAGVTTTNVPDLQNGTTYRIKVRAVYPSSFSDSAFDEVTAAGAPSSPSVVSVEPGDGELVIEWAPPTSTNGAPIVAYTVSVSAGTADDVEFDETPLPTEATIDGLTNGDSYTVVITATNSMGSAASAPFGPVFPCAAISEPTDLIAIAGDSQVSLAWSPPESEGCGALESFEVYVDGDLEETVDVPDTSTTITGLTNDTEYSFTVKAVNDADEVSEASEAATATPTGEDDPEDPDDPDDPGDPGSGGGSFPAGRIGGADRYDTAARLSRANFDPGVSVVYLTSGLAFADALSGGPIAERGAAPILLVRPSAIPTATAQELERLDPERIVILGGTAAVSEDVATAAARYTNGTVTRIGGDDRYETSALLSASAFSRGVDVAYLATGASFADALAAGPAAGGAGPVLLVTKDAIPPSVAEELTRLAPDRIVILGGTSAISEAVEEAADAYTSGTVTRIGGQDRYETSALLTEEFFSAGVSTLYLATGLDFADALAAAPLGAPILLVSTDCIPRSVFAELARLSAVRIVVLGGTSAVSDRVRRLNSCV